MKNIRYAVVGLGHIAQTAVLPAFKNAKKNSQLTALVSSDPVKLRALSKKYQGVSTYLESDFDQCLRSGEVDAVYICTPNTDHQYYVEKALENDIHVLCEKPLAASSMACRSIIEAQVNSRAKLMVAYRLHFDPANLKAIEIARSKAFGELRIFNSVFSFQVADRENIRLQKKKGGGPLNDIGIYCINAARYLFSSEPSEVYAQSIKGTDSRFEEVPEMLSVAMKFPKDRLATFVCSFGAADCSRYDLIGTKGSLTLNSAYEYADDMELKIRLGRKSKTLKFKKHDQFAAELLYFSDCIINNKTPEPSAQEGLADLQVVEAIQMSLEYDSSAQVDSVYRSMRPTPQQKIFRPPVRPQRTIHVTSPSKKH